MAVRRGGAKDFLNSTRETWTLFFRDEENIRTLVLMGIVLVYVILVDIFSFDLEIPLGALTLRFSSYEFISILVLTGILRFFWRAGTPKCFAVSFSVIVALASAFRYGFEILLPGLG